MHAHALVFLETINPHIYLSMRQRPDRSESAADGTRIIYVRIYLEKWPLVAGEEGRETVRAATISSE